MTEHDCKKYLKEFAMWARFPIPQVIFGDENTVNPNKIQICIGSLGKTDSEKNRGLEYVAVAWLINMAMEPNNIDKITAIFVSALFGDSDEPPQT